MKITITLYFLIYSLIVELTSSYCIPHSVILQSRSVASGQISLATLKPVSLRPQLITKALIIRYTKDWMMIPHRDVYQSKGHDSRAESSLDGRDRVEIGTDNRSIEQTILGNKSESIEKSSSTWSRIVAGSGSASSHLGHPTEKREKDASKPSYYSQESHYHDERSRNDVSTQRQSHISEFFNVKSAKGDVSTDKRVDSHSSTQRRELCPKWARKDENKRPVEGSYRSTSYSSSAKSTSRHREFKYPKREDVHLTDQDISQRNRHGLEYMSSINPSDQILLILIGLPGSGKSTFSRSITRSNIRAVNGSTGTIAPSSHDNATNRTSVEEGLSSQSLPRRWISHCQDDLGTRTKVVEAAVQSLVEGYSIIIDRCNFNVDQRKDWVSIVEILGNKTHIIGLVMPNGIDVDFCSRRAFRRGVDISHPKPTDWTTVCRGMKSSYVHPKYEEGFQSIFHCRDTSDLDKTREMLLSNY